MIIEAELNTYFYEEVFSGGVASALDPEEDLIASGVIDSLAVMQLTTFIHSQFNVSIEPHEITAENFRSLRALADLIESKINKPEATTVPSNLSSLNSAKE